MQVTDQLLFDTGWGELDYLVLDLPPGTGDVQLTLAQKAPLTGAIIVSTPQDIALADAERGLRMFNRVEVPVLGIVENMSTFVCPHCQKETEIFSHGGAKLKAKELGVDFLGEIPIDLDTRAGGDLGKPVVVGKPDSAVAREFLKLAEAVIARTEKKKGLLERLKILN
jgi:ATP-binding protein involved in chromosome partitioning